MSLGISSPAASQEWATYLVGCVTTQAIREEIARRMLGPVPPGKVAGDIGFAATFTGRVIVQRPYVDGGLDLENITAHMLQTALDAANVSYSRAEFERLQTRRAAAT